MQIAPTGFPGHLNGIAIFRCRATSGLHGKSRQNLPESLHRQTPISLAITSSIVSSEANRFLAITRCAGRSAFFNLPFGFVCLATASPNGGILSPGAPPNQKNGPSDSLSGSKKIQTMQAEGRPSSCGHVRTPRPR